MNPFDFPITIQSRQVLGYADEVDQVHEVSCSPGDDLVVVRRTDAQVEQEDGIPSHLEDLYHRTCEQQTPEVQQLIAGILRDYADVFSKGEHDLGLTHLAEHVINTGDAQPIREPPRRVPTAYAGEDKKALEKLLEQGCIRPSSSPWACGVVLVRKKDGSVRHCCDYRRLNSVTRKDAFPLPRTEDCLDALAGSKL